VDTPEGAARVLLVAALVDAPTQTSRFDGATTVSRISAAVEAILTGLGYGTYGRYEIEQRLSGDPSELGRDLPSRIGTSERQLVDLVGGPGSTDRLLAEVTDGARPQPDAASRAEASELGEPTGEIRVPTITLHTTADPLVLVQNESLFAARVRAANRQGRLLQLYVTPPKTFSTPAPYGAGHCNFTDQQRLTTIELLDTWVRTRQRPSATGVHAAISGVPGMDAGYLPPAWPSVSAG
jgi:hypothetical protein